MSEDRGSTSLGMLLAAAAVLAALAVLVWGGATLTMVLRSDQVAMPGWGWTALTVGLTFIVATGGLLGASTVVQKATEKPRSVAVVVLTLVTTVTMEIAKEAYSSQVGGMPTALVSGGAAGVVFLAGVLCQAEDRIPRLLGMALACLPPAMFVVLLLRRPGVSPLDAILGAGPEATFALVCLVCTTAALVVLARRNLV